MVSLRESAIGLALALALLPHSAAAQIPVPLRGPWVARNTADELRRLGIGEAEAQALWRTEQLRCQWVEQAPGDLPPGVIAAAFSCATPAGLLQLGVTRVGETMVVTVVSPLDVGIKLVVLDRPKAAAAPPPRDDSPPPRNGSPPAAPAPARDSIPQFPWPPPQWTLRTVLPEGLGVAREGEALGLIFDRLRTALRRAQISEWTVYGIDTDGFALVARLEHIDENGLPAADRWSGDARPRSFSIADYVKALFTAKPGRYRVIAFVVTAKTVVAGPAADRQTIEELWQSGASELPVRVRGTVLPQSGRAEALVYEFFRPSQDDPPVQVSASRLTVPLHLAGAGLWRIEELTR